ncbi:MAG: hypothetical protein HRF42_03200 [Candidatus Brocadia sp.]|jgi:uncharacterized membrane protein (DUF485 family)
MSYTIIFKNSGRIVDLGEKVMQLFASLNNFKETHKSFFMKCAVIFMSVKLGLILLATFSAMTFLLGCAAPYLVGEMSKTKAILFVFPLTMIIMLKLYFIGKILMTYDRSSLVIKSVVNVLLLKGRQGLCRVGETITADLSPLFLEKAKNR